MTGQHGIKQLKQEVEPKRNALNFSNGRFWIIGSGEKEKGKKLKEKNIYLFSQEILKFHAKTNLFKKETIDNYPLLFNKERKIYIYFDEIHNGGSSERSNEIIESFINHDKNMIDMFFMVTTTFTKPNIAYEGFLDNQSPIVLQWGYEDPQL